MTIAIPLALTLLAAAPWRTYEVYRPRIERVTVVDGSFASTRAPVVRTSVRLCRGA